METYNLELDKDQLQNILKSVDFYVRIQTGQISELVNPYMVTLPNANYSDVDTKIKELKKIMFPDLPDEAYYSIRSKYISDEIRQLLDIFEVIRYALSKDDNVDTDKERYIKPRHWSSEKDLPKVKIINNHN